MWGVSEDDYRRHAEPWPLNPEGELLLGLKIESKDALRSAHDLAAIPGIGFAEWGPSDMVNSFGRPGEIDPPYPEEVMSAMHTVRKALAAADVSFHCGWSDPSMTKEQQVDYLLDELGARILVVPSEEHALYVRGRQCPELHETSACD